MLTFMGGGFILTATNSFWGLKEISIRSFKEIFSSRRLTIWLLVIIAVLVILGTVVPQESRLHPKDYLRWKANYPALSVFAETIQLHRIYTSWWFAALTCALVLNLVYSFLPRIRPTAKAWKRERKGQISGGIKKYRVLELEGDWSRWAEKAEGLLRQKGYKVWTGEKSVYANKHLAGLWGVLAFHFSFLIILLGIIISLVTKFEGQIELVSGQTVHDEESGYVLIQNGILAPRHDSRYGFRVNGVSAKYWVPHNLRFIGSDVSILWQGKEVASGTIGYNEPIEYRGYVLYQGKYHGWAALFGVKPHGAKSRAEGYVNFPMPPKGEVLSKNHFTPPSMDIEFVCSIIDRKDTSEAPESMELGAIFDGGKKDLGRIKPGGSVAVNGTELTLVGFSQWSSYFIVRDSGIDIIFTGFWSAIASLFALFFRVPKSVLLAMERENGKSIITIAGKTSRYEPTFRQELEDLVRKIEEK